MASHPGLEFLQSTPEFQERYGIFPFFFFCHSSIFFVPILLCFSSVLIVWTVLFCAAETVVYRIFYYINRAGNGHLTLRELKRGNLIAALQQTDEEEDINKVLRLELMKQPFVLFLSAMLRVVALII